MCHVFHKHWKKPVQLLRRRNEEKVRSLTQIFSLLIDWYTPTSKLLFKKNVFTKQQLFLSRQKSITGINVKVGYNNKSNSSIFRN